MCLRRFTPNLYFRLGMAALAIANIASYVLRKAQYGDVDFVHGLLFGMSFGLLALSMRRGPGGSRS